MKLTLKVSKAQSKQLDALVYAHDEMRQSIDDIGSMANGGDIGWNQAMELSANVDDLLTKWKRMEAALVVVNAIRSAIEDAESSDVR